MDFKRSVLLLAAFFALCSARRSKFPSTDKRGHYCVTEENVNEDGPSLCDYFCHHQNKTGYWIPEETACGCRGGSEKNPTLRMFMLGNMIEDAKTCQTFCESTKMFYRPSKQDGNSKCCCGKMQTKDKEHVREKKQTSDLPKPKQTSGSCISDKSLKKNGTATCSILCQVMVGTSLSSHYDVESTNCQCTEGSNSFALANLINNTETCNGFCTMILKSNMLTEEGEPASNGKCCCEITSTNETGRKKRKSSHPNYPDPQEYSPQPNHLEQAKSEDQNQSKNSNGRLIKRQVMVKKPAHATQPTPPPTQPPTTPYWDKNRGAYVAKIGNYIQQGK